MTVTSKEDGSFSFEQIPFGIWYVREIEQPTGFVLNETVYEVNIAENEQVVEIEIVNEFVRGNITLTKVDADFPDNKLTGATFEVYQDNNADGKPRSFIQGSMCLLLLSCFCFPYMESGVHHFLYPLQFRLDLFGIFQPNPIQQRTPSQAGMNFQMIDHIPKTGNFCYCFS